MGLDTVELVLAVEQEFEIEIPNAAAEKMISVRHVRDFIVSEYIRLKRPDADRDAIFSRLRDLVAEQTGVKIEKIHLDSEFIRDLRMD